MVAILCLPFLFCHISRSTAQDYRAILARGKLFITSTVNTDTGGYKAIKVLNKAVF